MMHQRPIFDEKLVKRFEYDRDLIKYIDGKTNKMLDKLVIHPIEVGNKFELKSKENAIGSFYIPVEDITEINTPEQDAVPGKKDLLVEIEFKDSQGNKRSVAFRIQDKHIEEILVKTLKPMEQKYWDVVDLEYIVDGTCKTTQLYYKTPFLSDGEELLWINAKTEGIVNKHLRWLEALTNFRAIYYDFNKHDSGRIPLSLVDDVIVRNQRPTSESSRFGTFTTNVSTFNVSEMSDHEMGRTVGDVLFVRNGNPIVTFVQVSDPYRLAGIARAVISQSFSSVKSRAQLPIVEGPVIDVKTSATGEPVCSYCGTVNQVGSKFCSTCGFALR